MSTGTYAEITQISALKYKGDHQENHQFSKYVMPKGQISTTASDITGLTVERTVQGTRIMLHTGEECLLNLCKVF